MDRSPILLRVDGNPINGWENFHICSSYASAMQRRRRGCYFMGTYDPFPILSMIQRGGNETINTEHPLGSPEDCDSILRMIHKHGIAGVVVAGENLSVDYLRELSSSGAAVMVFDSEAGVTFPSQLVVNPLLGPGRAAYSCERGTQMLIGARYAMVRSIFRRQRPLRSMEPPQPFRILMAMGDNDLAGQSLARGRELIEQKNVDKVWCAIRTHHPDFDELRAFADSSEGKFEVMTEINELATKLLRCHVAITSGDTWSLEMACVGIPQLIVSQSAVQSQTGRALDGEGAANYLGDHATVSAEDLRQAVQAILGDPIERTSMSRCGKQAIDGRGPDRMVNALEVMLHPARKVGSGSAAA